jgi:hypothetical protein
MILQGLTAQTRQALFDCLRFLPDLTQVFFQVSNLFSFCLVLAGPAFYLRLAAALAGMSPCFFLAAAIMLMSRCLAHYLLSYHR